MTNFNTQIFDYENLHDTLINKVKNFIDFKTLNDDPESDPIFLFPNVVKSLSRKLIVLYEGNIAHVVLSNVSSRKPGSLDEPPLATIPGGIVIWIPGEEEADDSLCKRYCDICEAYFNYKNLLGLPGCRIESIENSVQQWRNINLSDEGRKPIRYTVGYTGFVIHKEIDPTVYSVPIP